MKDTDPKIKNPMLNLLDTSFYGIHEVSHPLAKIWRLLLRQMNLSGAGWITKTSIWQTKLASKMPKAKAANLKNNVCPQLAEKELSWNTLCRGYTILGFTHFNITITAFRGPNDNKGVTVELTVTDLNDYCTNNNTDEDGK